MKCIKGKEISVHHSRAGWYIGCWDEEGPYCRISGYYGSKEEAERHLELRSFWREADEIWFCNRGHGCLPEEDE